MTSQAEMSPELSLGRSSPDTWLRLAQQKISRLSQLTENWDSYGSRPVQQAAIEQASGLLFKLANLNLPHPHIVPVPGGGIQLEFQQESRELEIEILPDGLTEYLMVDKDGEMLEGSIHSGSPSDAKDDLYRLVHWLQGKQVAAV